MKHTILLFLTLIMIASCGGDSKSLNAIIESEDLETIRAKRAEIVIQQQEINQQLARIDEVISELDSIKKIPLVTGFSVSQETFKHFLEVQGSVETKKNILLYPFSHIFFITIHLAIIDLI